MRRNLPNLLAFLSVGNITFADSLAPTVRARVDAALAENRPSARLKKLSEVSPTLTVDEIREAIEAASGLKEFRERGVLMGTVLRRWCELKPSAAFDYVATLPESRTKMDTISYAAAKIAGDNPANAASKVSKLPGRASRVAAVETVAEIWAKRDPRAVLKWADSLPDAFSRETAITRALFVWVHDDPEESYQVVKTLPAGDMKNALITNIAAAWGAAGSGCSAKLGQHLAGGTREATWID
jgi:hypothetical protein